jgi:hypothetical protein
VFFSWLLSIFPREIAYSWRLVRRDLLLWVALATLLSLASIGIAQTAVVPGGGGGPGAGAEAVAPSPVLALIGVLGMLVMATLPPVLFLAAARRETLQWADVGRRIAGRILPLFAYFLIAALLSWGAASLVLISAAQLLQGTPVAGPASGTLASIILVSILCAFAFLPFLVLLSDRSELPESLWEVPYVPAIGQVFWPLFASARMTVGLRWSIAPYVILNFVAPRLAPAVPVAVLLPAMVGGLIISLVSLAVEFDYWLLASSRHNLVDFELEWPDKGFGER